MKLLYLYKFSLLDMFSQQGFS